MKLQPILILAITVAVSAPVRGADEVRMSAEETEVCSDLVKRCSSSPRPTFIFEYNSESDVGTSEEAKVAFTKSIKQFLKKHPELNRADLKSEATPKVIQVNDWYASTVVQKWGEVTLCIRKGSRLVLYEIKTA